MQAPIPLATMDFTTFGAFGRACRAVVGHMIDKSGKMLFESDAQRPVFSYLEIHL
ncbi:MAG: hypothetical protein LUC34_01950 [Campylobacter sp.]|nr:hypothetical protein [Campylobacter sp.]